MAPDPTSNGDDSWTTYTRGFRGNRLLSQPTKEIGMTDEVKSKLETKIIWDEESEDTLTDIYNFILSTDEQ